MQVVNVHRRILQASLHETGALIDSLSSAADRLWPWQHWPRMRFDRALTIGAVGGHGPIRYRVDAYVPGRSVRFRFLAPRGFDGFHALHAVAVDSHRTELRHTLQMNVRGFAVLSWCLFYRPLHDALVEDALDHAQRSLGLTAERTAWSTNVKVLRWLALRAMPATSGNPS